MYLLTFVTKHHWNRIKNFEIVASYLKQPKGFIFLKEGLIFFLSKITFNSEQ